MQIKHFALATTLSILGLLPHARLAQAYPVDCAILLCLAGGWPTSSVCLHAKAVFIERITPFPIEPPLQIWNCPMRAGLSRKAGSPMTWSIQFAQSASAIAEKIRPYSSGLRLVANRADIDISDPAYDFVRSIRVFHIRYSQRRSSGGNCTTSSTIEKGIYGEQGEFRWMKSPVGEVPKTSKLRVPADCQNYSYRSVFVDWRGSSGGYGKEEVRY